MGTKSKYECVKGGVLKANRGVYGENTLRGNVIRRNGVKIMFLKGDNSGQKPHREMDLEKKWGCSCCLKIKSYNTKS
jgi:hypothetical protein